MVSPGYLALCVFSLEVSLALGTISCSLYLEEAPPPLAFSQLSSFEFFCGSLSQRGYSSTLKVRSSPLCVLPGPSFLFLSSLDNVSVNRTNWTSLPQEAVGPHGQRESGWSCSPALPASVTH